MMSRFSRHMLESPGRRCLGGILALTASTVALAACDPTRMVQPEPDPALQMVEAPFPTEAFSHAMNGAGLVVGQRARAGSTIDDYQRDGFLWDPVTGDTTILGDPDCPITVATDINAAGTVVGITCDGVFRWTAEGGMEVLPSDGHAFAPAQAVSESGLVAWGAGNTVVLWHPDGTVQRLTAISDLTSYEPVAFLGGDRVVLRVREDLGDRIRTAIWDGDEAVDIGVPGFREVADVWPLAANDAGEILILARNLAEAETFTFLFDGSQFHRTPIFASAMNGSGDMAGCIDRLQCLDMVTWSETGGIRPLGGDFDPPTGGGVPPTITAMNDRGEVSGWYSDRQEDGSNVGRVFSFIRDP